MSGWLTRLKGKGEEGGAEQFIQVESRTCVVCCANKTNSKCHVTMLLLLVAHSLSRQLLRATDRQTMTAVCRYSRNIHEPFDIFIVDVHDCVWVWQVCDGHQTVAFTSDISQDDAVPCVGLNTEIRCNIDNGMERQMHGPRCVVDPSWWCYLTDLTFAWPGFSSCFVAGVDARHVVFVGLNRPFCLDDFLSS